MSTNSTSAVALSSAPKKKLIDKIAAAFSEELGKLVQDPAFKSAPTVVQVAAQAEFVQWFQLWFDRMPDADKSALFGDVIHVEPITRVSRAPHEWFG